LNVAVRIGVLIALSIAGFTSSQPSAQAPPAAQRPAPAPINLDVRSKLEIVEAMARYRVQEQLAGINFPSEAVGETQTVTGTFVLGPGPTVDATQSKLTVDLRTLKSDQDMRDGYLRRTTLETDKFPLVEFVPRRIVGFPASLAGARQAGFQLVGDMTLHGVTHEVTWNVVVTFSDDGVAGRAVTTLTFAPFKMAKPSLARLLSVDDKIQLEVQFKSKRTVL
jgi:polyisoprenoid-binding protein YceI